MRHENICLGCMEANMSGNICPRCGYRIEIGVEASLFLVPGTILAGKYLVGRVLGQGGFGITYLAWDTNLDIRIAVKEFFPQGLASRVPGEGRVVSSAGSANDQFSFGVERFLLEAKMLARFEHHPCIVTVRDFFKENGTAYMVMSYIDGMTLENFLTSKGGKISVENTVAIIMPVLDALKEVHEVGIMHRDISPDNIFIDHKNRIILIDFGAARQEIRDISKSLSVILKAGFAPEEQYRSRGRQGPWSDVYAVGATFYRCITGNVPVEAMDRLVEDDLLPPSQLGVAIEPAAEKVLLKAISVKAENRYQNVDEFQKALLTAGLSVKETPCEAEPQGIITPDKPKLDPIKLDKCPTCYKQIDPSEPFCLNCEEKFESGRQGVINAPIVELGKSNRTVIYSIAATVLILLLIVVINQFNTGYSTSIDGAAIQVGAEVNDDLYIVSPKTNLSIGEDFYVSFDNNASFESDYITMKIENSESGEVLEEVEYNVDPEWTIIVTEMLYFPDPGKFKVSFMVNEKVRATQEVVVGE